MVNPGFHSECDVAALVYGQKDDPDVLLRSFALRLIEEGFDVLGVVQRRSGADVGSASPVKFVLLPDEESRERPNEVPDGVDCTIRLEDVAARLATALRRRPDLLVLNRYGSMEVAGAGLLDVLSVAIELEIPVAIAVPEALFGRWLNLANGLAVKLQPNLDALNRWWRSLRRFPSRRDNQGSICEMFK
jgi:Protein of unknown function (DUF2478)